MCEQVWDFFWSSSIWQIYFVYCSEVMVKRSAGETLLFQSLHVEVILQNIHEHIILE